MKKVFYLVLTLMVLSAVSVNAQVRIGGSADPNPSALLDLNATDTTTVGKLGLALPRVKLTSTADVATIASPATGLTVYNLAPAGSGATAVVPGVYFWTGSGWNRLLPAVPVSAIKIYGSKLVGDSSTVQLRDSIFPVNATNPVLTWSSSDETKATVDQNGLVSGKAVGSVVITAKAADDENTYDTFPMDVYETGHVTIGSNNYSWAQYPGLGVKWFMSSSLVEPSTVLLYGNPVYDQTAAQTACPAPWRLPTRAEATAFANIVNESGLWKYGLGESWQGPGTNLIRTGENSYVQYNNKARFFIIGDPSRVLRWDYANGARVSNAGTYDWVLSVRCVQ
jgi:hypothetical protein